MTALPITVGAGVVAALITRSLVVGTAAGVLGGFAALTARAIRRIRRSARYESDELYRNLMVQPSSRWLTTANVITSLRFPGAIAVLVLASRGATGAATALLFALIVTDMVDGLIARWFNQQTRLGDLLDPIADRVTVLLAAGAALVNLEDALPGLLSIGLLALVVRDGVVLLVGLVLLLERAPLPSPNLTGKVASVAAMVGILATYLLSLFEAPSPAGEIVAITFVGVAAIVGTVSMLRYASLLRQRDRAEDLMPSIAATPKNDPYAHGGVLANLEHNPLNHTLVGALHVELMLREDHRLDLLDPLDLVAEELKLVGEAIEAHPARRPGHLRERFSNLTMLEEQILLMRP